MQFISKLLFRLLVVCRRLNYNCPPNFTCERSRADSGERIIVSITARIDRTLVILMKGDTFRRHVRDGKRAAGGGGGGRGVHAHTARVHRARTLASSLGPFSSGEGKKGEGRPGGNRGRMIRSTLLRTRLGLASSPALYTFEFLQGLAR